MFKTATEAADWIQGARYKGQKNGLENMRALLAALGNPQNQFRSVHIAGTNGKGSTAAYTESILRQAGYRTGMYTSPYLITYNERVQVMGKPIPDADLISLTSRIRQVTERLLEKNVFPTTFELGTALAFAYFAQQKVDFAGFHQRHPAGNRAGGRHRAGSHEDTGRHRGGHRPGKGGHFQA